MTTNEPLIMERTYNAPIQTVWKAITSNAEMAKWYFKLADFKPEVGFEFEFYGGKDGASYRHLCKVTEVVTGAKITYSWRYDGHPGISYLTWELFAEGNKTRLKLTHSGLESFPYQSNEHFDRKNFVEGWTFILGASLQQFLEQAN
jgi:uncharacterized protein YndB with AHSA1/START domain